ncbi:hypothetical protein TNCV_480171 [Trichonephila clavipes]|nr:hypothetical protein TNCV_480171 [Trichonephila clavipes]
MTARTIFHEKLPYQEVRGAAADGSRLNREHHINITTDLSYRIKILVDTSDTEEIVAILLLEEQLSARRPIPYIPCTPNHSHLRL